MHIQGLEKANPADTPAPERYSVTADYFAVMGIPVLRGRVIGEQDTPASEPVILVSDTAARTLFSGQDPSGRRVRIGGAPDAPWRTIVGIVGDVRHADLTERAWPQMYLPQSQFTDSFLVLAVKTLAENPSGVMAGVRAALREQDPAVPLYSVAPLDELVAKSVAEQRFLMWLLGGFAIGSLLLAGVGLYGVVAYTVAQRTREVGLRVALGASRADVFRLVLGSAGGTVAAGIMLGMLAALVLTRFLEGQLFHVQALDPVTIAAAAATLGAVATAAHLVPIRRALQVDPTVALRQE
jgi:putative ABC transport system permease protein